MDPSVHRLQPLDEHNGNTSSLLGLCSWVYLRTAAHEDNLLMCPPLCLGIAMTVTCLLLKSGTCLAASEAMCVWGKVVVGRHHLTVVLPTRKP